MLLSVLAALLAASPAQAAAVACAADPATGCIGGTIRTAAGEPAAGIALTITGQGLTLEAATGADGRWSVPVTTAGDYEVAVDDTTLPAGETLRDPAANPRTVTVRLGSSVGALFPLGAPTAGGGSGSTPTGGEPSDAPGSDPAVAAPDSSKPSSITGQRVAQQVINGIVFGLLLALASVGLSLIYGTTGLSNFAHGEQVTLGALLAYVGCQLLDLPLLVSGTVAVLVGAASGWLQDAAIWHPLRTRRIGTTQQMIVTIGLSMALQYTYQFFFGGSPLRIVTANPKPVRIGGMLFTQQSLISAGIAIIAIGAVAFFLVRTRTGRATRAVSDNPALAAASGITVERIVRIVWTLGAGLAALGGVLLGLYFNATNWNMGGAILLLMFAAVTLGGLGTAWGALVGSLVIGLVVELSTFVIPSDMRYAGALVILILVLLVRPQGILGRAERIG
ncbi:branched-chain amino acid ABC transporter permease [Cellulomonas chengniuliangii]|uniref:Branched-chain amino acid ABC transporter permease n=1 Tax=Cellulomonas chengniuliangii TaxID=2968084 RepID=A0ABY5L1G1_9CELL|nr:branched-chain amino acid ABC transporter permease [Cellulomonas chengniuliangii]MCC2308235.1 branched-chain amino acid ABC transporter permease [Cellulomonas chengniuliangii]UUI76622.1 branched-chain amino acid ABC transporter permease [Cellulomonas chengniuliangii]